MMLRVFLVLAPLPLFAMSARGAWPGPPILPRHDVAVVYRISSPGRPVQTWRVRYRAQDRLGRAASLDGATGGSVILLNIPAGQAEIVLPQMHALVDVPGVSAMMEQVLSTRQARFTKLGTDEIAGHRCTKYLVLKRRGDGTACITRGGVVLEAQGQDSKGSVSVRAVSLTEAPQDPALFAPPSGYQAISLPPSVLAGLLGG